MTIDITIEDDGWQALPGLEELSQRVAEVALGGNAREVCLLFTSDAAVQDMNRNWRGIDQPTNVLSFPFQASGPMPKDAEIPLGDIALAFETVAREAEAQHKTLADHTSHLIAHGILHLLGYDHQTEAEAEAMEQRERDLLSGLGIKDPYET